MKLRPYQEALVDRLRKALRRNRRVLAQCPTGGGKTVIASFITASAVRRGKTTDFICHRDFLVDQTTRTFQANGLMVTHVAAGRRYNPWNPSRVSMVSTLRNRMDKIPEPDLCIWDEAHHLGAATWSAIMDRWTTAIHIGLSATPVRLDGKGLDKHFDELVTGPSVASLIAQGALSDYRYYEPSAPDMSGVHTLGGDYRRDEVDEIMDRSVLIGDTVRHYRSLANGKRAVYFCTSVKHSRHVAATFNAAGIPARHLDGNSSTYERMRAAHLFANGELDVLTNVDLFGEGYDLASQAGRDVTIEAVGLCRPTRSLGLFMQQTGRALRPKDAPAIILDHAGNRARHGLPDDGMQWSLAGVEKQENAGGGNVRQCAECLATIRARLRVCPHCGSAESRNAPGEGRTVEHLDGDLVEVERNALRKTKKLEEWTCVSVRELIDLGRRRGYRNPESWAGHIWTAREARKKRGDHSDQQAMDFYQSVMR